MVKIYTHVSGKAWQCFSQPQLSITINHARWDLWGLLSKISGSNCLTLHQFIFKTFNKSEPNLLKEIKWRGNVFGKQFPSSKTLSQIEKCRSKYFWFLINSVFGYSNHWAVLLVTFPTTVLVNNNCTLLNTAVMTWNLWLTLHFVNCIFHMLYNASFLIWEIIIQLLNTVYGKEQIEWE